MKNLLQLVGLLTAAVVAPQGRWVPDAGWLREPRFHNRPKDGYVTKKATALAIGRAVIEDVFSPELRKGAEPYDAKRFGDIWVVYGYRPNNPNLVGGTVSVEISASTGTVVNIALEK